MSKVGDKWADRLTSAMGSWRFIIIQAFVMICWAVFNTLYLFNPLWFDPYPFIFMNLAMSAQAAFTAPIIMMSSNRAAASDRSTLMHDVKLDEESLAIIKRIESKIDERKFMLLTVDEIKRKMNNETDQ